VIHRSHWLWECGGSCPP